MTIVGNISTGKSTMCKKLIELLPDAGIFIEDLEGQEHLIEAYYGDKRKWTPTMQFLMLDRKRMNMSDAMKSDKDLNIIERTMEDNAMIFAKKQYLDGFTSEKAWKQYLKHYEDLSKTVRKPDVYLYLKADPELLFKRKTERDRRGEEHITLEYLKEINDLYDKWIDEVEERGESVYRFTVDHNLSDEEIVELIENAKKVRNRIFQEEYKILNILNKLLPSQFNEILFYSNISECDLPKYGTQRQQAVVLVGFYKQNNNLSGLLKILKKSVPHFFEV
jgi:deoxyadenosine/deoxycytidine kinase